MTDSKDTTMEEKTVPTTEITTDEYHCDPNADVTIISKDNVRFRASSHFLVKFSKFFEDLLSLPYSDKTKPPINLDYPSNAIRAFLDLASTPPKYRHRLLGQLTWDTYLWEPFLQLLEFTLCDTRLIKAFRVKLIDMVGPYSSINLLKMASNRQDVVLARAALSKTADIHIPTMCGHLECSTQCESITGAAICKDYMDGFQYWFREISLPYQVEILQLILVRLKHRMESHLLSNNKRMDLDGDDWEWIAAKFDPDTPMSDKLVHH